MVVADSGYWARRAPVVLSNTASAGDAGRGRRSHSLARAVDAQSDRRRSSTAWHDVIFVGSIVAKNER